MDERIPQPILFIPAPSRYTCLVNSDVRVARPPEKPLMIYDGDCSFCGHWIRRWKETTGGRVDYEPLQNEEVISRFPEIPREHLQSAVHLIEPDGRVTRGAEAVFRSLAEVRERWLRFYQTVPEFAAVSEAAYRFVARHRGFFSLVTRLLWGTRVERPTYVLVRRLFLSLLGVTYLFAFLSLSLQLEGLIGDGGIMPANSVMQAVESDSPEHGLDRFRQTPTLCWWSTEDSFLNGLAWGGVALSVPVILNLAPAPCLALLWLFYLSLAQVSSVFLGYQWDNLLLEAGFLGIFLAPMRLWPNAAREAPPPRLVIWLLRWLLFRLFFSSGLVKLLSGDPAWRELTALSYHFETQPLPTAVAWYVHQWPDWILQVLCGGMFFVELVLPLLIFLPRRPRLVAFWGFVLLMLGIEMTGNYTFFNFLTLTLCVVLLDDFALLGWVPERWRGHLGLERIVRVDALASSLPRLLRRLRSGLIGGLAVLVLGVSLVEMSGLMRGTRSSRNVLVRLSAWVAPFRTINSYGLFAVMTTSRPEIIVEGSRDGENWLPYEFRYKPGDPYRRPLLAAPHQPRLDWQMWFAALGNVRQNPWFVNFCVRLLQGKPEVLALLKKSPFPEEPPKFIRASLYLYHFTTPAERRQNGTWWRREYLGEYCPPLSLRQTSARTDDLAAVDERPRPRWMWSMNGPDSRAPDPCPGCPRRIRSHIVLRRVSAVSSPTTPPQTGRWGIQPFSRSPRR